MRGRSKEDDQELIRCRDNLYSAGAFTIPAPIRTLVRAFAKAKSVCGGAASMSLHFVGGAYGSGKSTICKELAKLTRSVHLVASELVRHKNNSEGEVGKTVVDVRNNQQRLIDAIKIRPSTERILLDGHYCVYDRNLEIQAIPEDVFSELRPTALVLLQVNPVDAIARLKTRDGGDYDIARLERLIEAEAIHARIVAKTLRIPLLLLDQHSNLKQIAHELIGLEPNS